MKIDIQRIARLMSWLADTHIHELEWGDDQTSLRLRRDPGQSLRQAPEPDRGAGPPARAADPEAQAIERVHVTASAVGRFLDRAPLQSQALVMPGSRVEPGDLVGLLQAGPILLPLRAEVAGIVAGRGVQAGEAVEYRQVIMSLEAVAAFAEGEEP